MQSVNLWVLFLLIEEKSLLSFKIFCRWLLFLGLDSNYIPIQLSLKNQYFHWESKDSLSFFDINIVNRLLMTIYSMQSLKEIFPKKMLKLEYINIKTVLQIQSGKFEQVDYKRNIWYEYSQTLIYIYNVCVYIYLYIYTYTHIYSGLLLVLLNKWQLSFRLLIELVSK